MTFFPLALVGMIADYLVLGCANKSLDAALCTERCFLPKGVTIGQQCALDLWGNIWVPCAKAVSVYRQCDGSLVRVLTFASHPIAVTQDCIVRTMLVHASNGICVYDALTGRFLRRFQHRNDKRVVERASFSRVVMHNELILRHNPYRKQIQVCSKNGKLSTVWSYANNLCGAQYVGDDIAVSRESEIYLYAFCEQDGRDRILVFDLHGQFQRKFTVIENKSALVGSRCMLFDRRGHLLLGFQNWVQVRNCDDGSLLAAHGFQGVGFNEVNQIWEGNDGALTVADTFKQRVRIQRLVFSFDPKTDSFD